MLSGKTRVYQINNTVAQITRERIKKIHTADVNLDSQQRLICNEISFQLNQINAPYPELSF